jgi:hypothetical protein
VFFFSYSCVWPKKLIISKSDLGLNIDSTLNQTINTACTAAGVYNPDINDFACTRPCPLPKIPEPLLMTHNWTNTSQNAEYRDELVFSCKWGQKLVSKPDFSTGLSSDLKDDLKATCLITGWFNDTIGSYTCTRNCSPPANYSLIMKNDWATAMKVVIYGTTFR